MEDLVTVVTIVLNLVRILPTSVSNADSEYILVVVKRIGELFQQIFAFFFECYGGDLNEFSPEVRAWPSSVTVQARFECAPRAECTHK
jgi:hypothetical protein